MFWALLNTRSPLWHNVRMGYKRQVAGGFSWLQSQSHHKGLTLVKIIVLARILSPLDFWIVWTGDGHAVAHQILPSRCQSILIQTPKNPASYFNSAWVVSIVRGGIIGAIVALSSIVLSRFYTEPVLLQFLLIASIIPVIKGFINPAEIKFQRELQYHKDVYLRVVLVSIDVAFALAFALYFKSALAMVLSQVVAAIAEVVITHFDKTPPTFAFKSSHLRRL
jgi:hypothetical protein